MVAVVFKFQRFWSIDGTLHSNHVMGRRTFLSVAGAAALTAATQSVAALKTVFPANNTLATQLKQVAQHSKQLDSAQQAIR